MFVRVALSLSLSLSSLVRLSSASLSFLCGEIIHHFSWAVRPFAAYGQLPSTMSTMLQVRVPVQVIHAGPSDGGPDGVVGSETEPLGGPQKRIVVVGLGMVGISFM